ncbi:TerB family tellurite resistance protein [Pelagibacteraceae bacterium]|nr:TerB family tellurite resistance protein [Pelagibacteraceae bacterium]
MLKLDQKEIIGIAALLIHAAKIDEIYSEKEKNIIFNFIENNISDGDSKEKIMNDAEKLEEDSNQLLNYTKIIKDSDTKIKSEIIEQLWKILISDNNVDLYESNLMRRICGLIYFSDKESGEIKMKLIKAK